MDEGTQLFTKGDTDGEYVEYTSPTFAESIGDYAENEMFQGDEGIKDLGGLAETHVKTAGELAELKSAQPIVPDEYTFPQAPEGVNVDEQAQTDFTVLAKEIGLSQENLDKIIAFDLARAERYNKAADDSFEKSALDETNALKERWGPDFPANDEMSNAGFRKVLKAFHGEGDDMEKHLKAKGYLDDAVFKRMFRLIGAATSEDVFVKGTQASGDQGIPRGSHGQPILDYNKSNMPGDARK